MDFLGALRLEMDFNQAVEAHEAQEQLVAAQQLPQEHVGDEQHHQAPLQHPQLPAI